MTHCQCTHEGPPCALAQDCQRGSNAAHRAVMRVSWTEGGPVEPRCVGVCAFYVLLCSFETIPAKKQRNHTINRIGSYFYNTASESQNGARGSLTALTCMTLLLSPVMSASFCSVWASGLLS